MIPNNSKFLSRAIFVCTIIFVLQCLVHYFSRRPLWLDEQYVFNSLANYQYAEIFGFLKIQQAFPRLHLFCIKVLGSFFNNHVLALRFFSFVAMMSAFFIWKHIYQRQLKNGWLILLGVLSFACSYRLTYYAAELKPYSMDVFVVAAYCWFFSYQQNFQAKAPTKWLYIFSALLPFLMLFSYAGIFVVWMIGFNFALMSLENKKVLPVLVLNVILSAACFVIYYLIDLRYSIQLRDLHSYWKNYFICTDSAACFFDTFGDGLKKLITYWNGTSKAFIRAHVVFIPFFLFAIGRYGFQSLKAHKFKIFTPDSLGLILFAELFVFGILKRYPFTGARITLFLAPFVFYFILKGLDSLPAKPRFFRILFFSYYGLYSLVCLFNTAVIHIKLY